MSYFGLKAIPPIYILTAAFISIFTVTVPAIYASDFNSDSDALTNKYIFAAENGNTIVLTKTSNGQERLRLEVASRTVHQGIHCVAVNLWHDGEASGTLYTAQDKYGAIRVIGGKFGEGGDLNITPETAGTTITADPVIGEWYYSLGPNYSGGERREVVVLNETVVTPVGTFTGCVKQKMTGWGHPEWVDYGWLCPGVGMVKWEENNTESGWQEVSLATKITLPKAPVPDIKANDLDEGLQVTQGESVSISLSMNPGSQAGVSATWWFVVVKGESVLSLTSPGGWQSGLLPLITLPLVVFNSLKINYLPSTAGQHTIYFGVTMGADNVWMDQVDITVIPP